VLCGIRTPNVLERHLNDFERKWRNDPSIRGEEHGHWDWRRKAASVSGLLGYRSFAIECGGDTQGMMIVTTIKRCRLPVRGNNHVVYVEYLEVAPWNRTAVSNAPRYRGIGTVLIAAAIGLSVEEGNHGRIGLHALPQAEAFYRDVCQMIDLGPDSSYWDLRYFEMTESQAESFVRRGS
jgi:hypothetical protein